MAKYDLSIREEELKNKVAKDWFSNYDTTQIIGNIDFAIAIQPSGNELFKETEYLLWAEAKSGKNQNIYDSVVQLILTIGKNHTNEKYIPPKYIGALDAEKIAFIPYNAIMEVFSQTDFNWNVPPSDHTTKEFRQLKTMVRDVLEQSSKEEGQEAYKFDFVENRKELKTYISRNFKVDSGTNRGMRITQNNFVAIYNQWRKEVMPSIAIDFNQAKNNGLLDSAFFLADLMSGKDNYTLLAKLKVLLKRNKYILTNGKNKVGLFDFSEVTFRDNMQAHKIFWARYQRPPKKEYWDKIVERNDLLVPQDIRERKGSYYTPSQWVIKSQEYLANVLGENWQDEYYIWDCCAGTGNLLANLTNKFNIWASTLDSADVHIMHERIASMGKGSNLLDTHVFQFDFLNDDLQGDKVPDDLKRILKDPDERKKLVIYINPPYAEASTGQGKGFKVNVSKETAIYERFSKELGSAKKELFAQFFMRVYKEIPGSTLAEFSKLKILQAGNFADFRKVFQANLKTAFIVPARTFDNVNGSFPIGFFVWDTNAKVNFRETNVDVFGVQGEYLGQKHLYSLDNTKGRINDWLTLSKANSKSHAIGVLMGDSPDFQNNKYISILSKAGNRHGIYFSISSTTVIKACVYASTRLCIPATWLNDRDQFLYPRKAWKEDKEFQYDCLAYTLFHGQNRITSKEGINHWIPFTQEELDAPANIQSHFMSDFIAGRCKHKDAQQELEYAKTESFIPSEPIQFSIEAQAVMDAGRELWYYYMHHKDNELYGKESINVNASYYDIRRYFQGEDSKGRMNPDSKDETYMRLWGKIKEAQKVLAKKIEKKVYLYGFLLDETTLPEDEPAEIVVPEKKPVKAAKPKPQRKAKEPTAIINYGTLNIYEK